MNTYYAVTNYHLLCSILHSIKYHSNEKNILYLSNWHPEHQMLVTNLKKSKIFYKVQVFKEVVFPSGNKKISNIQINKDIDFIMKSIPKAFINDVNKSNNIYIAGDNYGCSIYLVKKRIKYNYIEEACGLLSDEGRLMNIVKKIDYSRYQIMKKLKLPGNHADILNRFGDLNHQLPGYKNEKDIHFSVDETLKTLSHGEIYKIVKVFSNESFKLPDNKVTLLLTFHYVNMNLLTMSDQKLLYYYLIDYFYNEGDNLVIKQHPSDVQPDYPKWFPKALILPRKLPSELLPFLNKNKYNQIITAYSTSIFSFNNYCDNIISFNSKIEKDFKLINKYYFLLMLISKLELKNYNVYCIGVNESIINNIKLKYKIDNLNIFFVNNINEISIKDNKAILIGNKDIEFNKNIINNNDLVFSLEPIEYFETHGNNKTSLVLNKELINSKKSYEENYLDNEIILLYCLNNNIILQINNTRISKELSYSNIKIELTSDSYTIFEQQMNRINRLKKEKEDLSDQLVQEKNNTLQLENRIEEIKNNIVELQNQYEIKLKNSRDEITKYKNSFENYQNKYEEVVNSSSWKLTKLYRKIGYHIKRRLGR
ncbi:MAG: hypothetical protein IKF19_03550 [Bacilli bacterium]|nr:hypothetical protein [Bacilli bacterium]